jgi:uncharacterized protein (TIGR00369 family)
MNSSHAHEKVLKSMNEMAEQFANLGINLILPPPSNHTFGTRYTEIDLGKSLSAEIKFNEMFCNPLGIFQGGILCGVFDEVYGPLTYMASGRPVVTIEMSTTFLRPFTKNDEVVSVRAELVAKTKTLLVLKAEARNKDGKLIAISSNHSQILSDDQLKGGK